MQNWCQQHLTETVLGVNVSIHDVAMGELEANEEKLKELVDAANGRADDGTERTCHLVTIPAGVLPSDVLVSSPIVHGGSGGSAFAASATAVAVAGGGGDMGGGFGDFGGIDPNPLRQQLLQPLPWIWD